MSTCPTARRARSGRALAVMVCSCIPVSGEFPTEFGGFRFISKQNYNVAHTQLTPPASNRNRRHGKTQRGNDGDISFCGRTPVWRTTWTQSPWNSQPTQRRRVAVSSTLPPLLAAATPMPTLLLLLLPLLSMTDVLGALLGRLPGMPSTLVDVLPRPIGGTLFVLDLCEVRVGAVRTRSRKIRENTTHRHMMDGWMDGAVWAGAANE